MHHSSGPMRIYRAGPDEIDESGDSCGGGGNGGSESRDIDEDADTNKLDYNYY